MSAVMIRNRHVECPECNHTFEVRRTTGEGATYVKDWKSVPMRCQQVISLWLSYPDLANRNVTKDYAYGYCVTAGLKTTAGAFFARVSELVGLGILKPTTTNDGSDIHDTTRAPKYRLDVGRAVDLLNGGRP